MRANSPYLDSILDEKFNVLDHGFVRVVDYMGDDSSIVQAARVSYGAGTKAVSEDRGLIRYLMRNRHTSPFEMCEIKFHIKLPIFVARQWIRHRTANVNEVSGRYSVMPEEFYVPHVQDVQPQAKDNKQGRNGTLPKDDVDTFRRVCQNNHRDFDDYNGIVGNGVARELARINLPLSTYTEWYWKIDLHNLLHFLKLRMDGHAQKEIRDYANILAEIVKKWVPHTFEAFEDYVLDAKTFSRKEMGALRRLETNALRVVVESSDLTKREKAEFLAKFGLQGS